MIDQANQVKELELRYLNALHLEEKIFNHGGQLPPPPCPPGDALAHHRSHFPTQRPPVTYRSKVNAPSNGSDWIKKNAFIVSYVEKQANGLVVDWIWRNNFRIGITIVECTGLLNRNELMTCQQRETMICDSVFACLRSNGHASFGLNELTSD